MHPDDPQNPNKPQEISPKSRRVSPWAIFRSMGSAVLTLIVLGGIIGALLALFHPDTPLSDEWNPTAPLAVTDPVTPFTPWKLRMALADPAQCVATLNAAANAPQITPLEESENCHVRNRVTVSSLGNARIDPVQTSCSTALRMVMWERHGVQPAAREILGSEVSVFRQIGSYSCRPIRTTNGNSTRWSTHATADAIDITGFDISDGRRIRLINDWQGSDADSQFLRAVRDSACTWFSTTLSPDYNRLHADHFHLQARGWGTCR